MKIIINADDFGYDYDTVQATIEGFRKGVLTSATIMANMSGSSQALAFASGNSHLSFGVHLTYAWTGTERPVSDPQEVSSLVQKDGSFLPANKVRVAAMLGLLKPKDIIAETEAQLALVRDHGVIISHVDSHGHLHKFKVFHVALRTVLPRFGIRRVRCAQNIYLGVPINRPTFLAGLLWRSRIRNAFETTDYMYMPSGGEHDNWKDRVAKALKPSGSLEVGVHPGHREGWRKAEFREATSFADICKMDRHDLISWRQVGS